MTFARSRMIILSPVASQEGSRVVGIESAGTVHVRVFAVGSMVVKQACHGRVA
jgi:hypothetical protein